MTLKNEVKVAISIICGVLMGILMFSAFQTNANNSFSTGLNFAISLFYSILFAIATTKATAMLLNKKVTNLVRGAGFFFLMFVPFVITLVMKDSSLLLLFLLPFVIIGLYSGTLKNKNFFPEKEGTI